MTERPTFAILGAAGFVARRHMEAIRDVGGEIVAVVDPHDAVGVIDQFAPRARYFRDIAPFLAWEAHLDFAVIATPNDLHAGQALASAPFCGAVIVEKPAVLSGADLVRMQDEACGTPIHPILNLRCFEEAYRLKSSTEKRERRAHVVVRYVVSRGEWYAQAWKGDEQRSGGLAFNIGIHVLDLLTWCFGAGEHVRIVERTPRVLRAVIELQRATVDLYLAAEIDVQPERTLTVDGEPFDFGDLAGTHLESYRRILAGKGWTLDDAAPGIALAERLRGRP